MMRMSGADAFMLLMETPCAYMHTFKVAILDPSTDPDGWSFDKFHQDISDRLHLIPHFRWKYAPVPLGLNHPMWLDDPTFNLDYHLRRVACPEPGDHRALCEFMSSVYAYQLDRSRPLWISWVVEGLQGGKVAVVTLVHHAYVDGVGAAWGLQQLFHTEPGVQPDRVPPWQPRPWPSPGKRLWWGLRDLPAMMFTCLPKAVTGVWKKRALDKRNEAQGIPRHPSAAMMKPTPINRNLSPGRTFVCNSIPLDRFKTASKGLGVTINDVFLACCAGTVRRLLQRMDFDADQYPLVSSTPFAGARPEGMQGIGNFATVDYCWLATNVDDPLARLRASHTAAMQMKEHMKASVEAGSDISSIMQVLPPWLVKGLRWYIKRQQGRFSFFGNVLTSNVPGPKEPIYLNRYRLDSWFSTGQVFDGTCLNITMWSYCGKANLCFLADKSIVADGWVLYDDFVEELEKLEALVPEKIEESETVSLAD